MRAWWPRGDEALLHTLDRVFGSGIEWQSCERLADAVALARSRTQLLLVYIHSPFHTDTSSFCATTLYAPRVRDALAQFTCWAVSVDSDVGHQAGVYFGAAVFPFVAIVAPHQLDAATRAPRVVKVFDGALAAAPFETAINDIALRFADNLRLIAQQRAAADKERSLRAEQVCCFCFLQTSSPPKQPSSGLTSHFRSFFLLLLLFS